jgi:alanine racemase
LREEDAVRRPNLTGSRSSRRQFMAACAGALGASGLTAPSASLESRTPAPGPVFRLRPGGHPSGFDPWIEILEDAFRHNVREVSRLADGTPILAVIKNNAYGLGDQLVGPIVAACEQVAGLACVRVSEALAMRAAGVRKPILNMAEASDEEIVELARHEVRASVWLDDAPARLGRAAKRLNRPIPAHLYLDTGMGREGMPDHRARAWVETLCTSRSVRVDGTYMMFTHDLEFDREQLSRFRQFTDEAKHAGLRLGRLHASPSFEVVYLPEARLDMVRPGNLLFGNYSPDPKVPVPNQPDLKPVFRLRARVARLEQLREDDGASFYRRYIAAKPTWIALLPVGHTDGYPAAAAGKAQVLIRGRLYPIVSVISSTHTVVEIGDEKSIEVGDVATLIGPDDPAVAPHAVAAHAGVSFYSMITKMSALLPRRVV